MPRNQKAAPVDLLEREFMIEVYNIGRQNAEYLTAWFRSLAVLCGLSERDLVRILSEGFRS